MKDGRDLFIIERRVNKQRFHISTRCHNLTAAMKQLARFEADPLNYSPAGEVAVEPILLTAELQGEWVDWQIEKRGNTKKHAHEMGNLLIDWMDDLDGLDLRTVSLRDHIKPALERRKSRAHRIIAIKSFYSWLRKERHLLTSAQDPTLDLVVPQGTPEKWRRRKAVPFPVVKKAAEKLPAAYRDALVVMAGTGWHVTELERFIRAPESEVVHAQRKDTLAVLVTRHKGGQQTRTPVRSKEVLAAAVRLRKRGEVPRRMNDTLRAACRKAKVDPFTFGVMRHSVATWASERGASVEEIAAFLEHKDPRTTARFYRDVAVPTTKVRLPTL